MATAWPFPRCTVVGISDGDTVKVTIDLGLDLERRNIRVRFLRSDAPEIGQPGAAAAKARLAELLPVGTKVGVESARWDRYANRIDGGIFLGDGTDIEALMLAEGLTRALP